MELWKKELYENELYHHGILGMKWGVRRYQNKDGTLTNAGKVRAKKRGVPFDEASGKTKDDKYAKAAVKSVVNQAVSDDYRKASEVSRAASQAANDVSRAVKNSANEDRKKAADKIDLSSMSDAELQRAVNRMNLERSFKSLSTENVKSGKDTAAGILSTAGDVLAVGASAATLAYTIYKIRAGI